MTAINMKKYFIVNAPKLYLYFKCNAVNANNATIGIVAGYN